MSDNSNETIENDTPEEGEEANLQHEADGRALLETNPPEGDRIAKAIARAGIASRRDAEALIAQGRVTLNGTVLTSPAINVTDSDKIVVDGETDRVLGVHILGHDAGEMAQLLAISMKMGARKADFDATMALHPTAAEELVTMRTRTVRREHTLARAR